MVATTRRCRCSRRSLRHPGGLFLVLLFARTRLVPRAKRLRPMRFLTTCFTWAPRLVRRTNLPRSSLAFAFRTMGLLSPGDRCLLLLLAYRFDNRFVLSLALSSLAGWFGLTISHWPSHQDASYRQYALLYCVVVGVGGALLQRRGMKAHFFGTYLNVVANVLFWAVLSGVFQPEGYGIWLLALLLACGASLAWGVTRRQFAFVAYAAVYGYVGVSWLSSSATWTSRLP